MEGTVLNARFSYVVFACFSLCPLGPLKFLGVDLMDCFKDTERIQLGLISDPVLISCVSSFVL